MNTFEDQMGDHTFDDSFFRLDQIDVFRADHRIYRFVASESNVHTLPGGSQHFDNLIFHHGGRKNVAVSDKVCYKGVLWFVINILRCSDLLDISLIHDNDRIGHGQSFLLIMGNVDKSNAQFVFQTDQLILHVLSEF